MEVHSPGAELTAAVGGGNVKSSLQNRKQHGVFKQWCLEFSFLLRGAPAACCHEATRQSLRLWWEARRGVVPVPSLWADAGVSSCPCPGLPTDEGQQAGPLALQALRPLSLSRQSVAETKPLCGRVGGGPGRTWEPSPLTSGLTVDEELSE